MALLVLPQNVAIQRGFLDPPTASDLNGRDFPALDEVVDRRERNPQIFGGFLHG
jgi:hypothetical protein